MDKYEYQVCADQIKSLSSEGRFAEAMDIADTIDWRRVKSFSMLCTVSEIYKVNKHYEESRDILLLAYERYPDRPSVVYALCELEIKLGNIKDAKSFYKEYVALKPTDTNRYVLLYRLYEAMDYTLEDKIALLEEFKRAEYTEKWAYELAVLYHKTGQEKKCVDTCDELILWFGEGQYVKKAMELKMQHSKLTEEQQRKYDGTAAIPPLAPVPKPQAGGMPEIAAQRFNNTGAMTGPIMAGNGVMQQTMPQQPAAPQMIQQTMPQQQVAPQMVQQTMPQQQVTPQMPQNTMPQGVYGTQPQPAAYYTQPQPTAPSPVMGAQFLSTQDLIQPGYDPYAQQYQQTAPQPYGQQPYGDPYAQQGGYGQEYVQPVYGQPGYDPYAQQYQQTAPQPYGQQPYSDPYAQQPVPEQPVDIYAGIQVKPINTDKFSTMNLQEELAKNMQAIYGKDAEGVPASYYGDTSALYEPSQQQYQQQLDQAGGAVAPEYYGSGEYYQDGYVQEPQAEEPIEEAVIEMPVPVMAQAEVAVPASISTAPLPVENEYESIPEDEAEFERDNIPQQPIQRYDEQAVIEDSEVVTESEPVIEYTAEPVEETASVVEDQTANAVYEQPVLEKADAPDVIETPAPAMDKVTAQDSSVPKALEKELSQEYDGQISMSLPDSDMDVIKQITGQIDISDFLEEWEEKKRNAQKQRFEDTRRRQLEQTNDIMAQLADVIPGFKLSLDVPEEEKSVDVIPSVMPEIAGDIIPEADVDVVKAAIPAAAAAPVVPVAPVPSVAKREEEPVKPIVLPDYLVDELNEKKREAGEEEITNTPYEAVSEEPVISEAEELSDSVDEAADSTADITEETESEQTSSEDETEAQAQTESADELVAAQLSKNDEIDEEAIKAILDAEEKALAQALIMDPSVFGEPEQAPSEEPAAEETAANEQTDEEAVAEPVSNDTYEAEESSNDSEAETEADSEVAEEPSEPEMIKYPFEVTDYGTVEEIAEIDQPGEDDIFKTDNLPVIDYSENDYEPAPVMKNVEEPAEPKVKPANSVPSYMKLERRRESRRDFDYEEMRIFGRFEGIEALKAQIVDVIDDMSMMSSTGNVIVTGSEIYGRKSLAIDIVKAIQAMDTQFSGKVAKISGEALNKKDIPMTLHKLHNGALIVENAGGLNTATLNAMINILASDLEPILVVLEDEIAAMEPVLEDCPEMASVFNARIEMDDFSNEDFVAYARGYARELEYSIDEMGELALHTRISELQSSIDDIVTVDDIKDIVDAAIRHADRKNMSHFMDTLLAKRYDDDDYIILREKDFIF